MKKLIMVFSLFVVIGVVGFAAPKYTGSSLPIGTWEIGDEITVAVLDGKVKVGEAFKINGSNGTDIELVIGKTKEIFKLDEKGGFKLRDLEMIKWKSAGEKVLTLMYDSTKKIANIDYKAPEKQAVRLTKDKIIE